MLKKVLIVEDNILLADLITEYLNLKKEFIVVGLACNSLEAIKMLNKCSPDIIITDIVMPQADGFVLLEHINKLSNINKPEVIVLTALNNDMSIKRAIDLGAIFYIAKPFSMEDLYERAMYALSNRKIEKQEAESTIDRYSMNQHLSSLLIIVGIPAQNKGYQYLECAVKTVIDSPEMINSLTTKLYPFIAHKFGTNATSVERAMRHAIIVAFESGKLQKINELCNSNIYSSHYKPANGEFISLASTLVQNSMV